MEITYKKQDNNILFSSLEKEHLLNVSKIQNFVPLYKNFFELNDNNYNNINLNNDLVLVDIANRETDNKFIGKIKSDKGNIREKNIYFKLSPLLDPIKYITGKYDISNSNLINLPSLKEQNLCHAKINDPNNLAYVDSFFTYLTGKMLHNHNFIHGLDFYGSFLAIKNDYLVDVKDDIEYLVDSNFFHKKKGELFHLINEYQFDTVDGDTRNYRPPLVVNETITGDLSLCDISTINGLDIFTQNESETAREPTLFYEGVVSKESKSKSDKSMTCSSRSSNTDNEDSDNDNDNDEDEDDETESEQGSCSTASEDQVLVRIPQFPVQIITLERCEKTFDYLLMNEEFGGKELGSAIMQILIMLITYQKTFGLTHNDLHTNNIMYINTEKQFLYYKYNNKYYKVPTFGKIFKIIDFGRAIYKFRGNVICSDSFHHAGDAATQYNFEPYFDEKKPRLEPNFSFDLCRLGCSMFDFIVEDIDTIKDITSPIEKIILDWCMDDKGRNVLYKNNGEERYPDFKLYKMIARTVHNHEPSKVIEKDFFQIYTVSKKKINKSHKIFNIDEIPNYQ